MPLRRGPVLAEAGPASDNLTGNMDPTESRARSTSRPAPGTSLAPPPRRNVEPAGERACQIYSPIGHPADSVSGRLEVHSPPHTATAPRRTVDSDQHTWTRA